MGLLEATGFTLDKFESFVGVNLWTMIFAWINLLILYLLFKKFLFVPIKKMIDSRQQEIDDMYSDADSARKSAEELKVEYEEKMSQAEQESGSLRPHFAVPSLRRRRSSRRRMPRQSAPWSVLTSRSSLRKSRLSTT